MKVFSSRPRTVVALAGIALSATAMSGCGSSSDAAGGSTLRLSAQPGTGVTTLLEVADKEGFFTDAGLKVKLTSVTNGPAAATALASGSVDIATNAPEVFTPLVAKGVKLKLVSGAGKSVAVLVAGSKLGITQSFPNSMRALKGKKVGVTALSSTTQRLVEAALSSAGMKPGDVTFVAAGADVDKALKTGTIDAGLVTGGQIDRAIKDGATTVIDMRTAESCPASFSPCGIAQLGMWSRSDWAAKNPKELKSFQHAIARADLWVHDPANASAVQSFIGAQLGSGATQAEQKSYTESQLRILTAAFPVDDLTEWLDFDKKYGLISKPLDAKSLIANGVPQDSAEVKAIGASTK